MKTASTYDRFPIVAVPGTQGAGVRGWDAIAVRLQRAIGGRAAAKNVLVIDCYPGVAEEHVLEELRLRLAPARIIQAKNALLPQPVIDVLVSPFLGGNDPVFGYLSELTLPQFFDMNQVARLRHGIEEVQAGLVLVIGCGARLIADGDLVVYADLTRWEAQNRFRRNEASNLGLENRTLPAGLKYKRAYFVDWRVADRWKRPLIAQWDFVLETNDPKDPKMAEGEAVRQGLREAASRPIRVVPFFDPAPWGGQSLKTICGLDPEVANYGWCFDCVPEENSLRLGLGEVVLEIPAINLVFDQPRTLLGEAVFKRFGAEFPIRFDFLDTMGGGNLSFQVHPSTAYIRQHFGMAYTQDESYYLMDAGPDASVFLGLRTGTNPPALLRDLASSQHNGHVFDPSLYANRWSAQKHDHFLIPAGTVHCSGANCLVLEISATPYIFTFKLWDWGRPGLDGKPRPIHLEHGQNVIQWERDTEWTRRELVNRIQPVSQGPGWTEERTGLHEFQFIETRRHWFTEKVSHHTQGNVHVLNLIEGSEAVVESPRDSFAPFIVHYAETFIVPAAVGPYTIRPSTAHPATSLATIKAYVRNP